MLSFCISFPSCLFGFCFKYTKFYISNLFSRPKVQWNLIDCFLISTRNHAILFFFGRPIGRSVVRSFFSLSRFIRSQLNGALCATIHLGQSCCVLYACTNNRQQQPTDLTSSHCYFVCIFSSLCSWSHIYTHTCAFHLAHAVAWPIIVSRHPCFIVHLHTFNYNFISFPPLSVG